MATITREQISSLHDKITVQLVKEDYVPGFDKAMKGYAKTVQVPGFRKGMVPAGMVKKMYGPSIFNEEIIRTASKELESYLQKENLAIFAQPLMMPNESNYQLDMNNPQDVSFSFEVGLKPTFDIKPIQDKAKLTRYTIEVADSMIADELVRLQRRYGKAEPQETVTNAEDIIYASYHKCDASGAVIDANSKLEDTVLFDKLPKGMQTLLMGKKAEDTITIVPSQVCTAEELTAFLKDPLKTTDADANTNYQVTLTKVARLIPRELDETLYAEVFPNAAITSLDAFKEKLKEELGKEFVRISKERLTNEMYELLVHQTKLDLPVAFLKRWMKEGQEKVRTDEEVEAEFGSFDHQLRWTLISDKLIVENKIQVSLDDVKNGLKAQVMSYFGMGADDEAPWMDGYMDKIMKDEKTIDETYRKMLFDRLFEYLETQFTIQDKKVSEEEFFKLQDPHATHHHH